MCLGDADDQVVVEEGTEIHLFEPYKKENRPVILKGKLFRTEAINFAWRQNRTCLESRSETTFAVGLDSVRTRADRELVGSFENDALLGRYELLKLHVRAQISFQLHKSVRCDERVWHFSREDSELAYKHLNVFRDVENDFPDAMSLLELDRDQLLLVRLQVEADELHISVFIVLLNREMQPISGRSWEHQVIHVWLLTIEYQLEFQELGLLKRLKAESEPNPLSYL